MTLLVSRPTGNSGTLPVTSGGQPVAQFLEHLQASDKLVMRKGRPAIFVMTKLCRATRVARGALTGKF